MMEVSMNFHLTPYQKCPHISTPNYFIQFSETLGKTRFLRSLEICVIALHADDLKLILSRKRSQAVEKVTDCPSATTSVWYPIPKSPESHAQSGRLHVHVRQPPASSP
jgi:hypothetical protein